MEPKNQRTTIFRQCLHGNGIDIDQETILPEQMLFISVKGSIINKDDEKFSNEDSNKRTGK